MDEEATNVIRFNIPVYVGEECNNSHTHKHTNSNSQYLVYESNPRSIKLETGVFITKLLTYEANYPK
jgi:hypothetical protein